MTFRNGTLLALALAAVVLLSPIAVQGVDADPDDSYRSQLNGDATAVYDALTQEFSKTDYPDSREIVVSFTVDDNDDVSMFKTEEEARQYAKQTVDTALAAKYYSSPESIWLWDLPVTDVQVDCMISDVTVTMDGKTYHYKHVKSVAFTVSVPEQYRDDPSTSSNEVETAVKEVKDAAASVKVSGTAAEKAKGINAALMSIGDKTDEEGKVSNIHDALVGRSSSSAGIAAAFTYTCTVNNVDAVTVRGTVYTQFAGDSGQTESVGSTGYWNLVRADDRRYAVDCSLNSDDRMEYLMVGSNSSVTIGDGLERFSATHVSDLDLMSPNTLVAPSMSTTSYPYPDDTPFLEKYGSYILVFAIVIIMVGMFLYAVRTGNV